MFETLKEVAAYVFQKMISDVVNLPSTAERFEGLLLSPAVLVLALALAAFTVRKAKMMPRVPRRRKPLVESEIIEVTYEDLVQE